MKKPRRSPNSFFARLSLILIIATVGCKSRNDVAPLEKAPGEENLYLWGGMEGDEKVYLSLDPLRRLYRLEKAEDADDVIKEMKSRSSQLNIQVMPMGKYSFLLVSRKDASRDFPVSDKVKFQVPVYTSKKTGFTYFFDGIIGVRPKEGVSIEDILKNEPELELVQSLLGGTHFLYIDDGDKIITVANRIYESGLVRFSYPSYLAPIVLH